MSSRPKKEKSFEEAMDRLEAIVSEIESDGLGLERQFELFQEGMTLAKFCDAKLTDVQKSVDVVLKNAAGEWKTETFADASAAPRLDGEEDEDGDDRD
ncbi:MAG: exodeoxyribonuclease VII small subunit [Acidobacteriota bacterium]